MWQSLTEAAMVDELQRALLLRDLELMGQPRNPNAVQPGRAGLLDLGVGLQERLGLLNQMFNPVEAIGGSMRAGREMMAPNASGYERMASLGDMLSGVAGVVAPVAAGVRAGVPAATSLMESLLGGSPTQQAAGDMARQFGVDESGALRLGDDIVDRRGAQVMDLLRSGRAADVTDAMLDMGDPALNARLNEYLYRNYDLPMDTASRMARRDAGGFNADQPLYRGDQNPDALAFNTGQFAREGIGVTASDSPGVAATYMTGNTPAMYPIYARAERPLAVEVGGRNWTGIPAQADTNMGRLDAVLAPDTYLDEANLFDLLHGNKVDWGDGTATSMAMANTDNVARAAQAAGFDQVQFRDIVDRGGAGKYSTEAANTPHTTVMTSDPRNIRSRFARFDPRLSHLRNLSASLAAAGVPLGLLAMQPEQEQY